MDFAFIEKAIAAEAFAHVNALNELNPYAEAETKEIGGLLVYSGTQSSIHGAYGLGLEGSELTLEDRQEIEHFFARKERPPAVWVTPFTHPTVIEWVHQTFRPTTKETIYGKQLATGSKSVVVPLVDLKNWPLLFTQTRFNRECKEPDLLALTKLHQKETRFYAKAPEATYTFFYAGVAYIPYPSSLCLEDQVLQATNFGCRWLASRSAFSLPALYERTYYEQL